MMSYDGILSSLTEEKMNLFQSHAISDEAHVNGIPIEEGVIEEEQVAIIQTVQLPNNSTSAATSFPDNRQPSGVSASKSNETSTPQRKISTSTRFMNAFQQFYAGAIGSTGTNVASSCDNNDDEITNASNANSTVPVLASTSTAAMGTQTVTSNRTPTKGMEVKLLSMWHNVKYGWSGKIKSNFSKEQPVWLLGRCYHRKSSPPSSMETSAELTATLSVPASSSMAFPTADGRCTSEAINACDSSQESSQQQQRRPSPIASMLYPSCNPYEIDEIIVPQELGTDATESQAVENPWEEGIEGFRRDFFSRIWMTYRREFPTMNGSNYTSDCGWGCMLRSGQMLLAQALICHFMGRSWRYEPDMQANSTYEDSMHKKIIKWFGDSSSKSSPFSIHALVSLGEKMGKKPGDWYGPSSVSFLLRQALKNAAQENADFDNITIYVAKDCTVYIEDVRLECCIPQPAPKPNVPWQTPKAETIKRDNQHWKSLIVLIPLRLGSDKLNSVYAHCLKLLLSTEYCIGIIGGRPKHSLYFVGFQEDKLIHLDPHYCQEMVDVNQENFPLHTFHCKSPRKLKMSKMDPSCCIGFYCPTKADFDNFVESVQLYLHPMRCASGSIEKVLPSSQMLSSTGSAEGNSVPFNEMNYPLFSFSRGRCLDYERDDMSDSLYKPLQRQIDQYKQELTGYRSAYSGSSAYEEDDETEEFVLL